MSKSHIPELPIDFGGIFRRDVANGRRSAPERDRRQPYTLRRLGVGAVATVALLTGAAVLHDSDNKVGQNPKIEAEALQNPGEYRSGVLLLNEGTKVRTYPRIRQEEVDGPKNNVAFTVDEGKVLTVDRPAYMDLGSAGGWYVFNMPNGDVDQEVSVAGSGGIPTLTGDKEQFWVSDKVLAQATPDGPQADFLAYNEELAGRYEVSMDSTGRFSAVTPDNSKFPVAQGFIRPVEQLPAFLETIQGGGK